MQEVFYEESSICSSSSFENRKYNLFNIFSIFSFVIAVFWFFVGFYLFPATGIIIVFITTIVPVCLFVVLGVLFSKQKNKFSVDYDYTFITGSIRISKVIKNIKRIHLVDFECNDIEKIGKVNSESYDSYCNNAVLGLNFINATSNEIPEDGKDFYFIVYNALGCKNIIRLECTKNLIVNILKFSKRTVADGELLKWFI